MRHPHILFDKSSTIDIPNFSICIAFYNKPRSLEQCLSTAKKHAYNKNHEYICVADHDEHLIDPMYPTLKLASIIDPKGYFLKPENNNKMQDKIIKENITIKKCMDEYSDIKWVSLFEYLRKEKRIDGFSYDMGFPTDGRPGRGNFYQSYNLAARLASNDIIMTMVNDDMMFTPNWDLLLWQAFRELDRDNCTCVPVAYTGDTIKETDFNILDGPGAEPNYKIANNNWHSNTNYIFEKDFLDFSEKVKIKNKYLLEFQHQRHYGYMGFILIKKSLFFKFDGYNMENYPAFSQDIHFDGRLGNAGIKKCVVLDTICLHERILYVEDETKEILIGK